MELDEPSSRVGQRGGIVRFLGEFATKNERHTIGVQPSESHCFPPRNEVEGGKALNGLQLPFLASVSGSNIALLMIELWQY